MSSRYIVGIDLGTTHTVVAYVDTEASEGDEADAIQSLEIEQTISPGEVGARALLPSACYQPGPSEIAASDRLLPWSPRLASEDLEQDPIIGEYALRLGAKVPGRLIASAKSWLSHQAVDRTAAILPWGASSDVEKMSPVDASAHYLRHVRHAWDIKFPQRPLANQEVVLTVPASFDEGARALTLKAAHDAGLPRVRLVEEPQAAFYHWLDARKEELTEELRDLRLAIVIDVGGGTTDLTLIKIEEHGAKTRHGVEDEFGPRLTRIAVGEHLMLGGDNMDLALARIAEERVGRGKPLGTARFAQLIQQCRAAKETLLSENAPESVQVTVLGSGSKLIGGAMSATLTREEVQCTVLDGFLPQGPASDMPQRRSTGIVEFGLPYVSDAAITRHIAEFLQRHEDLAREALGDRAPADGQPVVPDAILFNGGVFRGELLRSRASEVLGTWRGSPLRELDNAVPDLAVAHGAVAYGLSRRGVGLRIGGGSPRSYYLALPKGDSDAQQGICLLPRGAEEGEELLLEERSFSLKLGRPVRFRLVSSASEVRHVRPGDILDIEDDQYKELPPIAAVLESATGDADELPVKLAAALTEVGTLEMSCVAVDTPGRRFKLEFQLRGGSSGAGQAQQVRSLHPRFQEATDRVRVVYGKSKQEVSHRDIKTLRTDLEKIIGKREKWDTPLLRELWGALFSGAKRRRRSPDHERVWFNLVGYTLRPGYGYPLDDWRVQQVSEIYKQGIQFMPEAQNWAEWWILWRRISGGLSPELQAKIASELEWYLEPPGRRPRKRPPGPKMLGYDDMVRLVGSLEHLAPDRKAELGTHLIKRLRDHGENPQSWWSVGRLGARVPFYGSAHNVLPAAIGSGWIEFALTLDWEKVQPAAFAATLIARASGDRQRDLDPDLRNEVARKLEQTGAAASWIQMVREVTHLEAADEKRIFGESLPPGLRLLD